MAVLSDNTINRGFFQLAAKKQQLNNGDKNSSSKATAMQCLLT